MTKPSLLSSAAHHSQQTSSWFGFTVMRFPYFASILFAMASVCIGSPVKANTPEICDHAARVASERTGVPLDVLRAITRSETGRAVAGELRPWPWTVNMEGAGKWFSSQAEALTYVSSHHSKGARSFDVGCFQVNYKWHGQNFDSIAQMFDPEENALYAASFLRRLRDEVGDWPNAAAAYHSRTPKHANRYRARFNAVLAALPDLAAVPTALRREKDGAVDGSVNQASQKTRQNPYPFLKIGKVETRFGSLVPLAAAGSGGGHLFAGLETSK